MSETERFDWRDLDPLELLSVPKAARRLKIDPATLRGMIEAGHVKALKVWHGSKFEYRVPAGSLADFHDAIRQGRLRELAVVAGEASVPTVVALTSSRKGRAA